MSRGTVPILTCDHEDGCDQWTIDYYALCADNWRDLLGTWQHDPARDRDTAYCPWHAADTTPAPEPCPECRAGKHGNCDGTTWDERADGPTGCPCAAAGGHP